MTDTCTICSLKVSRGDMQAHLTDILDRCRRNDGAWLLTLNLEMLARSVREPAYLTLMARADIVTADGMPLVWAARRKGMPVAGRTTGVDLVHAFLKGGDLPAYAVIGGVSPSVTIQTYGPQAVQACRYLFEDRVDLSEAQLALFCKELAQREVKLVFIALGVPKQDQLAVQLRKCMPSLVLAGVGGSFEILGPGGGRAPAWMQRSGLEWLYRFGKEPGRLWRRYLFNYPVGVWRLMKDMSASRT